MLIRPEQSKDYHQVEQVVTTAFASAEYSDGHEQELVAALRTSAAFIPELSLVAEIDQQIVGYILFTKAQVGAQTVLALAPLAVLPKYQNQGIGRQLIQQGHRLARRLGYNYVLVLGHEHYYRKFGYQPAASLGVTVPADFPATNFFACRLLTLAPPLHGSVVYAPEFGV
ncbi:GNAT family N-acetyltransferase [Lapidilactobacillus gannanensis]|uniref:GNAT family N-acetyltransferase n=1 Tax=Lapidilactobacillus gannanensis TaxID=2486002 RepID=A0ABW4BKT9_9LACO|nr:N-acetyltransferase [Lapidilactobacillus gannanensis]